MRIRYFVTMFHVFHATNHGKRHFTGQIAKLCPTYFHDDCNTLIHFLQDFSFIIKIHLPLKKEQ